LLSVAVSTGPALAEPGEEAVRIQYTAPATCPDEQSFFSQLRQRTARGRLAEPNELARTIDVELLAEPEGFSGNVDFLDDAGEKVSRHVHGEQCEAVVSSLALITALALDATANNEDAEPDPPPPPPPAPPLPAPEESPPESTSRVTERAVRGLRLGVLAAYGGATSAPRLGLLGQLDFRSGLALRVMAHYAWHELSVDPGRNARLQRLGLETSICPWRLERGAFSALPCAAVDLGALRASGVPSEQLTSANAQTLWWASLGAQLGLAWQPTDRFWLELRGAAEFPLRAGYRFTFENPHATAYEVPYLNGWAGIVAGGRFW